MERSPLTAEEQAEVWRRYRVGASLRSIDRALGRQTSTAWAFVASTGGLQAAVRRRSPLARSRSHRGLRCEAETSGEARIADPAQAVRRQGL